MEHWLTDKPHAVLPVEERALVTWQERPFQDLVDILAVDQKGNVVVVEVKRGQAHRDVIAQALEYGSDVEGWGYERLNPRGTRCFASKRS